MIQTVTEMTKDQVMGPLRARGIWLPDGITAAKAALKEFWKTYHPELERFSSIDEMFELLDDMKSEWLAMPEHRERKFDVSIIVAEGKLKEQSDEHERQLNEAYNKVIADELPNYPGLVLMPVEMAKRIPLEKTVSYKAWISESKRKRKDEYERAAEKEMQLRPAPSFPLPDPAAFEERMVQVMAQVMPTMMERMMQPMSPIKVKKVASADASDKGDLVDE
jgi:hypothetical protein